MKQPKGVVLVLMLVKPVESSGKSMLTGFKQKTHLGYKRNLQFTGLTQSNEMLKTSVYLLLKKNFKAKRWMMYFVHIRPNNGLNL